MPRKAKTHEEFVQEIEKLYPNKYEILSEYKKASEKIKVLHKTCGHITDIKANAVHRGAGCCICNPGSKLSQDQFEEKFYSLFSKGKYLVTGKYINNRSKVSVKHLECGCEFDIIPSNALSRKECNCPKCSSAYHNCIEGINDIESTNPDLFALLKDKNDGKKYKNLSHKYTWFKCPTCGQEIYSMIYLTFKFGLQCSNCSSNISFPERLMSIILTNLQMDFIYQFCPEWITPYSYDFMLSVNDDKYIIEMDGGFHYQDNSLNNYSLNEIQDRDQYKTQRATQYGYHVIRINCDYHKDRNAFIKKNILSSDLRNILTLDKVDWSYCFAEADKPVAQMIIDLWKAGNKSVQKIVEKTKLSDTTIRKYLYAASGNKIIEESIDDIKRLNVVYRDNTVGAPRNVAVKCNETGEIFKNMKEAQEKYHGNIRGYFTEAHRLSAGVLSDGTKLTWTKI